MFIKWNLIISIIIISTGFYVYFRYRDKYSGLKLIEPLTTLLFVILASVGTIRSRQCHVYIMLIMLSITFAPASDCNLLKLNDNLSFLKVVLFYWLGLFIYSLACTRFLGFYKFLIPAFIILLPLTLFRIRKFLYSGLKESGLTIPIIVYCMTWCYLLSFSLTIIFSKSNLLSSRQMLLILSGTGIYFLGDLDLSFYKFFKKDRKNITGLGNSSIVLDKH